MAALLLGMGLLGGRGWGADFTDRSVNDRVEELAVIGFGFGLDVLSGALAGYGVVGES
jgi:hypothetical protein